MLTNRKQKGDVNMVASNRLKGRIVELGLQRDVIADKLGISPAALSYKLNNKTEFKASEISILSNILKISDEKDEYFFI